MTLGQSPLTPAEEAALTVPGGIASAVTPKTAPAARGQYIENFPFKRLRESPTNPRRIFGNLDELADSIRKHGILEPMLVRPVPGKPDTEVVAGHRRYRAAILAGLTSGPVISREMSDQEALEIQLIENVQREDLHELDEADGYAVLLEKCGYTPATLAAKIGKSKATIHARLKLRALSQHSRDAWLNGDLDASRALLIARVPQALQARALKEILSGGDDEEGVCDGPMSARDAQEWISRRYTLVLAEAKFDPADTTLVPAAGACLDCPKLVGNARDLYPEVRRADVCTDPTCHAAKTSAVWARMVEKAKADGTKVLSADDSKRVFHHGGHLSYQAGYVELDTTCYEDPKQRTYRALVGSRANVTLARDPHGGIHELVARTTAQSLVKSARSSSSPAAAKIDDRAKKARELQRVRAEAGRRTLAALGAAATKPTRELLRVIVRGLIRESWEDSNRLLAERRGLERASHTTFGGALQKLALELDEIGLVGLAVELAVARDIHSWGGSGGVPILSDACKLLGVDRAFIEKQVTAELRDKKKPKAKPAPVAKAQAPKRTPAVSKQAAKKVAAKKTPKKTAKKAR